MIFIPLKMDFFFENLSKNNLNKSNLGRYKSNKFHQLEKIDSFV